MNGFVEQIGNDPILMVSAAIGVVLILFVVLVVVVANMRIRTYKDRYVNTRIDNVEKEKQISTLQKEIQEVKIRNAQNEQELQQFSETKKRLSQTEESLAGTLKELGETQKDLAQTRAQLENLQGVHTDLLKEHESYKERFEHLQEENSKLRVNNARLLMKLETEERFNAHHQRRSEKDGDHP